MEPPLTKIDAAQPSLFRSVKGSRKESIQPLACALIVDPTDTLPITTVRISWSELLAARLRAIAKMAAASGEAEGKALPYASLRAALQAQIPEAVLLARDLGAPWKKEDRFPFLDVQASFEPARDPVLLAAAALRTWMTMVLRPWAERVGIDDDLMEAVQDLATPDSAFEVEAIDVDLGARIREGDTFDRLKHGILQVIAKRLEGQELFEGLGPVYRVVRGSSAGNAVSFETWPAAAAGGRYSMVATLTVESGPFIGRPMVTVRASRRRWYDALPEPKRLSRLRTLTGTIMGRGRSPVAVEFTTPVRKGVPDEPFSPDFMIQALAVRQDLAAGLADMVARQGTRDVFVGIPYSPQLGGKHPVGGGATTRDHTDLFDAVAGLLEADGFRPLPFRQTEVNKRAPKRTKDWHAALQAEALIADIALSLGRNHIDGEALFDACRTLMSDGEMPEIKADTALKARAALEVVRAANLDRVRRAFGETKPTVAVLGRTERERAVVRSIIGGLFGAAVELTEYQLPTAVHGARGDLPAADRKARERFEVRVDAWTPLAKVIAAEHQGCHVLVQATDWYDRRKDDPVNKLAGRYALASRADANVQYLRPPAAGWRGLANYLHRVQAAIYDLLFGHSGLVSEVQSLLKGAFSKEATRPKAILGISVVTQARLRHGAGGGRICLATRVDAETGRTTARVGWFDGAMRWSPTWEPFFEAMKRIADPKVMASLGDGRNVERDSFQKFVRMVIDGAAQAGDRPLVLIDSTSAAGLWSWLTDVGIGDAVTLGSERVDMSARWPGVRIVRVRTGRAGRVVERKTARYECVDGATGRPTGVMVDRYCPAITERTVRLADSPDGSAAHYWVTRGYFQMSIPRGLSVYRNLTSYVPAQKEKTLVLPAGVETKGLYTEHAFDIAKAPYRLPNPIDVTVANTLDGDDPDRIVHLVASLRCGYGHTGATTTLPAPLSFESKARDYMTRFVLDADDAGELLDTDDTDPDDGGFEDDVADEGCDGGGDGGPEDDTEGGDDPGGGPGPGSGPGGGPSEAPGGLAPKPPFADTAPGRLGPERLPSASAAEPPDAWNSLIKRFGVESGGAKRKRLVGSTSLSGPSGNQTMASASALPTGVGQVPRGTRRSRGAKGVEDEASEVTPDERNEQAGENSMASMGTLNEMWPSIVRAPVLPIPPFVTREWLAPKLSAPPSILREIHSWRSEVRALSGYPWPKDKPTPDQFFDILLDGMRYPGFVRAVTRVAARHAKTIKKREEVNLFNPFRKSSGYALSNAIKKLKCAPPETARDAIRVLIQTDNLDVALGRIYLISLGVGYTEGFMEAALEFPAELGPVLPFLEAAKKHLDDDFSWKKDVVEQRGAPTVPPTDHQDDLVPVIAPEEIPGPQEGVGPASDRLVDEIASAPPVDNADAGSLDMPPAPHTAGIGGEDAAENGGGNGNEDIAEASSQDAEDRSGDSRESNTMPEAAEPAGVAAEASEMNAVGGVMPLPQDAELDAVATRQPLPPDRSGPERMAEFQAEWGRILAGVAKMAATIAQGEPDPSVIDTLISSLDRARVAARAWEDAKPRHVDPAPLVAQGRALASVLSEVAKQDAPTLADVALVTPVAAEAAIAVLVEVRAVEERVRDLIGQAKALSADFERIEEAAALKVASRNAARDGLEALRRFATVLADGTVPVQAPEADAGEMVVQVASTAMQDMVGVPGPLEGIPEADAPEAAPVALGAAPQGTVDAADAVEVHVAAPAFSDADVTVAAVTDEATGSTRLLTALETTASPVIVEGGPANAVSNDTADDDSALDDAAMDLLVEDTATDDVGEVEDPECVPMDRRTEVDATHEDRFALSVERKLAALFEAEEFGLAYHLLRAGARVFPGHSFPFTEPELRLVAMAGHINHAALQGNEALNRLVEEVRTSVRDLQADPVSVSEDVAAARRIALLGATATIALFHADSVVGEVLDALNGIAPGLGEGLYPLKDALMEASRSGVGLTPAMLRSVSLAAEEDRYGHECLKAIGEKIEAFSQMRFRFQLGAKIRQTLIRSDGAIGTLKDRLNKGEKAAVEAAREFAKAYSDRGAIITLLEDAEVATNNFKFQGVDGDARERLVANIDGLAALCREYVQVRDAAPAMKSVGLRAIVTNTRNTVLDGLERAVPALQAYADTAAPLSATAVRYTLRMLDRLRAAVDGNLPSTATTDHLLALHGPLLWVSGLRFGRSWLPSPYQPEIAIGIILAAAPPLAPHGGDGFAALDAAVRARLDEDSYVAARLLAEGGAFYGATEVQRGQLRDLIENNVQTRRDKLTNDIADVRRMVDRVQRMGMLRGVDDAQALLSLLDRIEPNALPSDVALDARDEDEENELILDFASAEAALDDVRDRVQRLLDKPRQDVRGRLEALASSGRVTPKDADRVRGLIAKDDLLTAGEYMGFLEDGQGLPETISPNPRFLAFFPAVTDALEKLPKREMEGINKPLQDGCDFGPFAYSRVPENRREDALALLDDWKLLRNRVQSSYLVDNVITLLVHFLDRTGLRTELTQIDTALSNPKRKVYVAEMRLRIPTDAESVLLPDFGSQTGGNYRVCVVAKMPSESDLISLCAAAGSMGVIVLVTSPVETERRRQLAWNSIDQNRRVLVIDEAIFLFALAEPEFRPLTMIECAQPFSFAAPYRDYGNQAVPPEMFFGRETEYRKLLEASGSCIVYGGRRLGKTALLQHIKATQHDPEKGMAVAYVNILPIGNNVLPAHLWEYASRELPAVFPEPVTTAADFTERVKAWLDADARRRVLVLFDESDRFIEADADDKFKEFIRLQGLMDTTNRRFKFVLAGLHNVTRLVHTENPPLKQIASDPQRIGPLMDAELEDAELLVTQPLAAMGYEFDNREDVWRILSHCNYYPVLVQTFCKGLLEDLAKEVVRKKKPVTAITGEHVRAALENDEIAREIGEMFNHTISEIEDRYALIANIMAERALEDSAAGRVGEGMSAADVLRSAAKYWPAAFKEVNRLSVIEDLLDEMEGLGVLRRVGADAWALRSHAILRLLGSETKIMAKLVEFIDRPAPDAFEPRSMRRPLHLPALYKVPQGHICPLTLGQEHDLLTSDPIGQVPVHARVIFGNALADLPIVAAAMRTAGPLVSDGTRVEIVAQAWRTAADLLEAVRQPRPKDVDLAVLVVDSRSEWDGTWLEQPLRSKPVRDGRVRLVFVGGPQHALRWVTDPRLQPLPPQIRTMPLQPWTAQMVDHCLRGNDLSPEQYRQTLRAMTGGFNRPMSQLLASNIGVKERFLARAEKQRDKLLGDKGLWGDLGLVTPMDEVFRRFPGWVDAEGRITAYEIAEGILPSVPAVEGLTGLQVVEYGVLMGLLEPEPVLRQGVAEDGRRCALNPLLTAALNAAQLAEAM